MKTIKRVFTLISWLLVLHTDGFADSSPALSGQVTQPANPLLDILAETVWVNVKNQAALTKVLLVLRNPADSAVLLGFNSLLSEKDTLVDFGISRRSDSIILGASDSSQPEALPVGFPGTDDSASVNPQSSLVRLTPKETVSVLLVYQTVPDSGGNRFRYVFPLKESLQTKGAIRSFAFFADIQEKSRIMEVKTEGYPIVVRGNGPKLRAYFWQNNLRPKADIGFSYRLMQKKPERGF